MYRNYPENLGGGGLSKIWGACAPWPQHRTATDQLQNFYISMLISTFLCYSLYCYITRHFLWALPDTK